jgi:phosphoglycerate dehydrogenase-like enzyme
LRWVHCDKAGLDGSASPEVFSRGLLITGSGGRSDPALAEHAIFFMLSLAYDSSALLAAQGARRWRMPHKNALRALYGRTVGILGLGHIGSALASRCKALGMHVLGYRRRHSEPPDGVDRVYSVERGDSLLPLLKECDFLALALPLTDATHGLIGAAELRHMKPSAFIINIARGALVDEIALRTALKEGRLAGAGLDVFSVEPLPRNSPLWTTPKVLITPHATPRLEDRTERSIEIIAENARRFRSGQSMLNLLTEREIYSRSPLAMRSSEPRRAEALRKIYRRLRSNLFRR